MKEFKLKFTADVGELEAQFKGAAAELSKLAKAAGSAEGQFEQLKEVGSYLASVDKQLSGLKSKYPDIFKQIFGNVDAEMKKAMEPVMAMPNAMKKILAQIGPQLSGLLDGTADATMTELKQMGKVVEQFAKQIGASDINFDFLDSKQGVKKKAQQLVEVLGQLEKAYYGVSKASVNAEVGDLSIDKKNTKKIATKAAKKQSTTSMSYEDLLKNVQQAKELSKKIDEGDDSAFDQLDKKVDAIQKAFKLSDNEIAKLEFALQDLDDTTDTTMSKLQSLFGDRFPTSNITTEIGNANDKVATLSDKINEVFQNAKKQKIELSVVLNTEDANVRMGNSLEIDPYQQVGNMLSSLDNGYFVDAHSHRDRSSKFNAVDFRDLVNKKKYGVTSTSAIFGEDGVNTVDLSGVSDADAEKVAQILESLNKVSLTAKDVNDAFNQIGANYGDVARAWNPESFDDLSKYFIQISNNADASITPLERFKNIITWFSNGAITDFSKFSAELADFKPENAGELFNKIVDTRDNGNKVSIDATKKSLTDTMSDIASASSMIDESAQHIDYGTKKVQEQIQSYEELCEVVKRYNDLSAKEAAGISTVDDKKELNNVIDRLSDTRPDLDLTDFLSEDVIDAEKFAQYIGVEIPQSIGKAQQAFEGLNNDGLLTAEERLERLKDLADDYGSNITQATRNAAEKLSDKDADSGLSDRESDKLADYQERIYAADEAIEEFGATYEKVILKLENGKNIEILPNDKGLRDLQKFADEGYGESFGGVDVEDVEFIRKFNQETESSTVAVQGQAVAMESLDAKIDSAKQSLSEFYDLTEKIQSGVMSGSISNFELGESSSSLEKMKNDLIELSKQGLITAEDMQNVESAYKDTHNTILENRTMGKLGPKEELGSYDSGYDRGYYDAKSETDEELRGLQDRNGTLVDQIIELRSELDGALSQVNQSQQVGEQDTNLIGEISQFENLREKLSEVVAQINLKTDAFDAEKIAVDNDVGAEIVKLTELENKLKDITEEIKVINGLSIKTNTSIADEKPLKGEQLKMDLDAAMKNTATSTPQLDQLATAITPVISALDIFVTSLKAAATAVKAENDSVAQNNAKLTAQIQAAAIKANAEAEKAAVKAKADTDKVLTSKKSKLSDESFAYLGKISKSEFIPSDAIERVETLQSLLKDITDGDDLDYWRQEWVETTASIDKASAAQEKLILSSQSNTFNGLKNELKNAYDSIGLDMKSATQGQMEFKNSYDALMEKLKSYASSRSSISDNEINDIKAEVVALKEKAAVYKADSEAAKEAAKKRKQYGETEANTASHKKEKIAGIASNDEFSSSIKVADALARVNSAYDNLVAKQKEFASLGREPVQAEREEFNKLTDQFNQAYIALNGIITASRNLGKNQIWSQDIVPFDTGDVKQMQSVLEGAINAATNGKAKIGAFRAEVGELDYSTKNANGTWSHFTATLNSAGTQVVGLNGKLKQTDGFIRGFLSGSVKKFKEAMTRFTGFDLFYRALNYVKQGLQYVKDIDLALTELKKVTDETDETYAKFLQTASKTGAVIGSTVADLTNATASFARLGYSITEAAKLAEAASIYKNVGDGIENVEQASESIISTMKAFGIEANNSMSIVDKFNEVGNNFAISSTGIGEALQRSASALYESGNTIDEAIGLITAANSVVQNPEQVGTALKTLSMRLRGAKVELQEAGEDTDGMATSVSTLQEKLLALTHGKVDILSDANTFKNTTEILREMSDAWGEMTDMERAASLELMGGKQSYLNAQKCA